VNENSFFNDDHSTYFSIWTFWRLFWCGEGITLNRGMLTRSVCPPKVKNLRFLLSMSIKVMESACFNWYALYVPTHVFHPVQRILHTAVTFNLKRHWANKHCFVCVCVCDFNNYCGLFLVYIQLYWACNKSKYLFVLCSYVTNKFDFRLLIQNLITFRYFMFFKNISSL